MLKLAGTASIKPSETYDLNKAHMQIGGYNDPGKRSRFTWIVQGGKVWEFGSGRYLGTVANVLKKKLADSLKAFGHAFCDLCGRTFSRNDGEEGLEGHLYYDHREVVIASLLGTTGGRLAVAPSEESILKEVEKIAGLVKTEAEPEIESHLKKGFKDFEAGSLVN